MPVKPPANLAPRPNTDDEELTFDQLRAISLFADLERPIDLEDYPSTMVLRRYRQGEIICEQNDPGFTAFYILTAEELLELRQGQLEAARNDPGRAAATAKWEAEIAALRQELAARGQGPTPPAVVSASVKPPARRRFGALAALGELWHSLRAVEPPASKADVREGEVFGEMSCLYRQPRSATVRAERDGYVLEFLRNILDKMVAQKQFKQRMDRLYRERVLELHLTRLPLFQGLDAKLLQRLRDRVELRELEPGDLICDEHDRPDGMFLIRMGFVQVVANASSILSTSAVTQWDALCSALLSSASGSPAHQAVWARLDATAQAAASRGAAGNTLSEGEQRAVVYALNDLLKEPKLRDAKELAKFIQENQLTAEAKKVPSSAKKWSQHAQVCRFNHRLLSLLYPGVIPPLLTSEETGRVLSYRSTGDPIGEMGLLTGNPRSATCVAYVHHGEGKAIHGRVELVRIDGKLFEELKQESPEFREQVRQIAEQRTGQNEKLLSLPVWAEADSAAQTGRFDELGLIQGQHLMLIDLDRCTRCDQCVTACVQTHQKPWTSWLANVPGLSWLAPDPNRDGRSRLFLDGPRFSYHDGTRQRNYLLPATCRQCADAICLVGCPVGSIHKGDHGEILIEDWCIGCSRCAEQCPYGSIQMHPVGLLPRRSHGWQFRREASAGWVEGATPFTHDRQFRALAPGEGTVHFRRTFTLSDEVGRASRSSRLELLTQSLHVEVILNGTKILNDASDKPRTLQGQRQDRYTLSCLLGLKSSPPAQDSEPKPIPALQRGANTVEVRLAPPANDADVFLDLGIYAYSKPVVEAAPGDGTEYNQEVLMNRAVVCDLCGGSPACVRACPHDAALRVETRSFFKLS